MDYPLPSQTKDNKEGRGINLIAAPYSVDFGENEGGHLRKHNDRDRNTKLRKCRYSRGSKRKKNKQEMARDRERGSVKLDRRLAKEREQEKEKLLQCGFWCGGRLSAHQRA